MILKEWFDESEQNLQAIYDARNGQRYIYHREQKLSKFAQNLHIEQVVELHKATSKDFVGYGAWLY